MKFIVLVLSLFVFLNSAAQKTGIEDMAVSNVKAAISDDEKLQSNYYLLKGQNALYFNNYRSALENAKTALKLHENNKDAMVLAADAYAALDKNKRALRYYKRAISLGVDDPELLAKVGITNMQAGNYIDAIENFDRAIILDPDNSEYYMLRGDAKISIELFASAIEDFEKVMELNEKSFVAIRKKGICYREIGNYVEALDLITKAISINENNAENFLERGKTYLKAYNADKACKDFEKAQELGSAKAGELIEEHCQSDQD